MSVYACAVTVCIVSIAFGAVLGARPGRGWSPAAPAVGLAAALVLASISVRAPGHGATGALVLGIGVVAAAVSMRRTAMRCGGLPAGLTALGLGLLAASLPFLATGRIGALGESANNDLAFHIFWTDALRSGIGTDAIVSGYPMGPHSLAAAVGSATGAGSDAAMLGLLIGVPALTALTAFGALDHLRLRLRLLAAPLIGLPFLCAGYMAEGSFKEPILALLVLGAAVVLADAQREGALDRRAVLSLLILLSGALADFGPAALGWGAALGVAAALVGLRLPRATLRQWAAACALAGLALVAVLLVTGQSVSFFSSGPGRYTLAGREHVGGNFSHELSPFEALGVWPASSHRLSPRGGTIGSVLVAFGALAFAYGVLWWWRRGRPVLPAAALATLLVWLAVETVTLPYFSGKALVIAAPLALTVSLGAVLAGGHAGGLRRQAASLIGASAFVMLVGISSALALVSALVRDNARPAELAELRPLVAGSPTLFVGQDDYAAWELRGARLWSMAHHGVSSSGATEVDPRPAKREPSGEQAVDVDSVSPRSLDRFRFVITSTTLYASKPPPNLRLVRRGRWYELWRRTGRTPSRRILDERGAPGRILDCGTAAPSPGTGEGRAYVRPTPILSSHLRWRSGSGDRLRLDRVFARVDEGDEVAQTLSLPPGRYDASIRYRSNRPLEVSLGDRRWRLPGYNGDPLDFWAMGPLVSTDHRQSLRVAVQAPRIPRTEQASLIGDVAFVRRDVLPRERELSRSCGGYVDFYRSG